MTKSETPRSLEGIDVNKSTRIDSEGMRRLGENTKKKQLMNWVLKDK